MNVIYEQVNSDMSKLPDSLAVSMPTKLLASIADFYTWFYPYHHCGFVP